MKQEIFRWITANAEFRKDDQIGGELSPGAVRECYDFLGVAGDITNRKIYLGQCDFDTVVHGHLRRLG